MEKNTSHPPASNPSDTPSPEQSQDQVRESRRRFAMAVSGSGVILSLASKPVMGATYACTASGATSGNTSSHGSSVSCLACSPGYWTTSPGTWPAPYYPYSICQCSGKKIHEPTLFINVFGSCPSGNQTMMWVMQNTPGSREFHAAAALLNAAKAAAMGISSAYTVSEVINLYKQNAPASTFSGTYTGTMENCTITNSNDNIYQAQNLVFCNVISPDGTDTGTVYHC